MRVCDIDPHSQCASTELRSEDVIIMLNGVDYLNRGHDAIFTALRGDSPTVTLQVCVCCLEQVRYPLVYFRVPVP